MVLPVPAKPEMRRPVVVALDELALGRVQEDGPLLPRVLQSPFKLFDIGEQTEAALGVGVDKGVGIRRGDLCELGRPLFHTSAML